MSSALHAFEFEIFLHMIFKTARDPAHQRWTEYQYEEAVQLYTTVATNFHNGLTIPTCDRPLPPKPTTPQSSSRFIHRRSEQCSGNPRSTKSETWLLWPTLAVPLVNRHALAALSVKGKASTVVGHSA